MIVRRINPFGLLLSLIATTGPLLRAAPLTRNTDLICGNCGSKVMETNPLGPEAGFWGATVQLMSRQLAWPLPDRLGRHYAIWITRIKPSNEILGLGMDSGTEGCNLANSSPSYEGAWSENAVESESGHGVVCYSCKCIVYETLPMRPGYICNDVDDFVLSWNNCFGAEPYSGSNNCATFAFYALGSFGNCHHPNRCTSTTGRIGRGDQRSSSLIAQ